MASKNKSVNGRSDEESYKRSGYVLRNRDKVKKRHFGLRLPVLQKIDKNEVKSSGGDLSV